MSPDEFPTRNKTNKLHNSDFIKGSLNNDKDNGWLQSNNAVANVIDLITWVACQLCPAPPQTEPACPVCVVAVCTCTSLLLLLGIQYLSAVLWEVTIYVATV